MKYENILSELGNSVQNLTPKVSFCLPKVKFGLRNSAHGPKAFQLLKDQKVILTYEEFGGF